MGDSTVQLREGLAKVFAPAREVRCVKNGFKSEYIIFLLEVVCSSHGAVLKVFFVVALCWML